MLDVVIADAYLKNITGFDVQSAYEAMKLGATTDRQHNGYLGYSIILLTLKEEQLFKIG